MPGLGIFEALFVGYLGYLMGHHRQAEPLSLEILHDAVKAHPFLPQEIGSRNPAILKYQLPGIRGVPAHLADLFGHLEAWGVGFNDQKTHATIT